MADYRNPLPTVDIIIEMDGGVVLVERRNPPRGWALPGGFVDEGEPVSAAAIREAREETSLEIVLKEQFFCYSTPDRDPRRHTLSVVFIAAARGKPRAADDAAAVAVFSPEDLPTPIAFDHAQILDDYFRYRDTRVRPPATR